MDEFADPAVLHKGQRASAEAGGAPSPSSHACSVCTIPLGMGVSGGPRAGGRFGAESVSRFLTGVRAERSLALQVL